MDIDTKDERNVAIAQNARAMAYYFTLLIFAALVIFLSIVKVDTYITLIFVGAYLVIVFLHIYFLIKYHKEM